MLGGVVVNLMDRHGGVNHVRLNRLYENIRELLDWPGIVRITYAC